MTKHENFAIWLAAFVLGISLCSMMYADSKAAVIGRRYGKHIIKVPFIHNNRTVEGSTAFFVTALICCFPTFLIIGQLYPGFSTPLTFANVLEFTFIMSAVSMLLELISPSKYDDLIMPLGSTLVVCLIAVAMGVW